MQGDSYLEIASDVKKLHIVKLTHTIIWCIFVAAILYICGVSRNTG